MHLAQSSCIKPLVVPERVANTFTTPISIISILAYRSTEILHRVAATSSLVTASSAVERNKEKYKKNG